MFIVITQNKVYVFGAHEKSQDVRGASIGYPQVCFI